MRNWQKVAWRLQSEVPSLKMKGQVFMSLVVEAACFTGSRFNANA